MTWKTPRKVNTFEIGEIAYEENLAFTEIGRKYSTTPYSEFIIKEDREELK